MIKASDIRSIVEHHLAMNQQLTSMDDTDDDCIAQIVQMMCSFSLLKKRTEYLENIKLFMPKMSSSSHVYQVLSDDRMVQGLLPFLQIKYFRPRRTIAHGLSIAHISQWKPAIHGVSSIAMSRKCHGFLIHGPVSSWSPAYTISQTPYIS